MNIPPLVECLLTNKVPYPATSEFDCEIDPEMLAGAKDLVLGSAR